MERPVLTMRVLLFLQKEGESILSDMVSQGWNKRTTQASIEKAMSLELVEDRRGGQFPAFKRMYGLTGQGEYVAKFVKLLEAQVETCLGEEEDFCRCPRGCYSILGHLCERDSPSISNSLDQLRMSPTQFYKCVRYMETMGLVIRERPEDGTRTRKRLRISASGIPLAAAAKSLDIALRQTIRRNRRL